MPIASPPYSFKATTIAGAPDEPGVYALLDQGEVIYYGRALGGATTIQSRLLDHLEGRVDECTKRATHYSWEMSRRPAAREAELLNEFRRAHDRLPRCNTGGG
jgi:excinuclease UvrABC nuclease subunit